MKYFSPILFLLFILINNSQQLFSQKNKSLNIIYKKVFYSKIDTSKTKSYKKQVTNLNKLLINYSQKISYKLKVINNESIFNEVNSDLSDNKNGLGKLAGSVGGTGGDFYVNREDSIYLNKKHFGGEDFLIKINIKKWKITDEFKFISNFKSYKAISEDIIINSKGTFKNKVIAWFCPELPSFFGPAGYFGLPGLILELDNNKMQLRASKVEFINNKKERIKLFNQGIKLSETEFEEMIKKKAREFFGKSLKN